MPDQWRGDFAVAAETPMTTMHLKFANLLAMAISGYMANLNHEAKWNERNRNAETVLVTVAIYTWNPQAYDPATAWESARAYVERTKNPVSR